MDENLHYLLHQELDGLFDPPAAGGAGGGKAPSPPKPVRTRTGVQETFGAAPGDGCGDGAASMREAPAAPPRDPKRFDALARLLGRS